MKPKRFREVLLAVGVLIYLWTMWQQNWIAEDITRVEAKPATEIHAIAQQEEKQRASSALRKQQKEIEDDKEEQDKSSQPGLEDAREYELATGRSDRVYCMIPSMYNEDSIQRWAAILETWGARCDTIKFFVDPQDGLPSTFERNGISADIVQVPMVRKQGEVCQDGKPCRHIWEKVWRSWLYVSKHDLSLAEWFLKIDDDTYFIPSNLRKFVRSRNWSPEDPHYFGHLLNVNKPPFTIISGVCTAFSRESIRRLGPRLEQMEHEYGPRQNFPNSHGKCIDRDGATEELVTSKCLQEVGVYAEETLDGVQEMVLPLGIPASLVYKRKTTSKSWYWTKKPEDRGDEMNCCSMNYTWGIHGYKGHGTRLREMERLMITSPDSEIEALKIHHTPGSSTYNNAEFILGLRKGISEDPFRYPQWERK